MPTKTSTASGLWSAGGTWVGGIAPVDDDTVVIAAGHVVDMDVDITAWANGVNGLTITSHATTPGELRCYTGATGKKGFKLKANTTLVGTNAATKGILRAGTSGTRIPATDDFEIILGSTAANTMAQVDTTHLDLQMFCLEPTIRYVQLTASAIVGATVLSVDQDVTAGNAWRVGDYVLCANAVTTGTRTADIRVITAVSSTTITIGGGGLTYALPQYSVIALRTRNVRFLIDSVVSSVKYAIAGLSTTAAHRCYCEISNRAYVGGTGTFYTTSGRCVGVGRPNGAGFLGAIFGGVGCGLENWAVSGGGQMCTTEMSAVIMGCDRGVSYANSYGCDLVFIANNYSTATSFLYGRSKTFCNVRGYSPMSGGAMDSGSRVEWTSDGLSTFADCVDFFWDGTIANCAKIGVAVNGLVLGKNARVGSGCTAGYEMYQSRVRGFGCRINHATPVSAYLNYSPQPKNASVVIYDYANSSDVPQYGQIRAWMGAGNIIPDTTPASPPSWFTDTNCHKMSHEGTGTDLLLEIPLVLEAGTPIDIQIALKLGGAGYSWTTTPRFELFDPAYPYEDSGGIVATAVDSSGAAPNSASTSWQTLYLDYTLPVASNRPRGSKQNFVMRARARVSSASGTPYWHWNYTQSPIVNANVVSIDGDEDAASNLRLSAGQILPGTVESSGFTPTTTEFEASDITEATTGHLVGRSIVFTSGALNNQAANISAYELDGGMGHFTVSTLTEAPADGDTFIIV